MAPYTFVVGLVLASMAPLAAAQDPYAITGVSFSGPGDVPQRRNIKDLQAAGGPQWDLYLQSLLAMQQDNYTSPLSYYEVGGIHGKPYTEWNHTGPQKGNGWLGYCPHGEELFLSWHRPYVLLYEQVLVSQARKIASSYPSGYRQQYTQAAENLRAPFWDWAADSTVPAATVPARVTVNVPNGNGLQQREIDNPLASFRFPPQIMTADFDPQRRPQTIRCPAPQTYPASANSLMALRPYKQWVYDAFTRATDFNTFAFMGGSIVSLEQIHNGIHWDGACGSQFLAPEFAGFDPLFMLHHAQVDRLWTYWQFIHPDQDIFKNSYRGQSRFSTPDGTTITPQSPLAPFFAPHRVALTTESVRSIRNFGYSYEGLEFRSLSADQLRDNAMRLINQLYGGKVAAPLATRSGVRRAAEPESTRRYFAHVRLDRTEVERPCEIHIEVNGERAGSLVVMKQPAAGILTAGVPLDRAIKNEKQSSNETLTTIEQNIAVKIIKPDGTVVKEPASFEVKLEDVVFTPPKVDTEFPTFGLSKLRVLEGIGSNLLNIS